MVRRPHRLSAGGCAMLQLNRTGYMHNRLRMVTASFLVKDLGIDWRRGERYFAEQLNDFDFSANNGGWQWAASTGCDAQPYFRIFNPVTQSEKFDPKGASSNATCPSLRNCRPNGFTRHGWQVRIGSRNSVWCWARIIPRRSSTMPTRGSVRLPVSASKRPLTLICNGHRDWIGVLAPFQHATVWFWPGRLPRQLGISNRGERYR